MTSIFESKIFASLSQERKDKIRAAYLNPVNVELVQQLSSYLDEPVEEKIPEVDNVETKPSETNNESFKDDSFESRESHTSSHTSKTLPSIDKLSDKLEDEERITEEPVSNTEPKNKPTKQEEPEPSVEPSVEPSQTSDIDKTEASIDIKACCNIPQVDLDTIKGTLNAREETTGVTQIRRRENEIWIYYGDKVNLNNILPSTIDIITYIDPRLEFNRLARSNNAIVFEVMCDTTYPVEVKDDKTE